MKIKKHKKIQRKEAINKLLSSSIKLIHIGTFGDPVGLNGDIKVQVYTSNFKFFVQNGFLIDESASKINNISLIKEVNGKFIVKINKMIDTENIKNFKGKKIFVNRINLPKIKKNEYYIADLINCKIVSFDKKYLGLVKNIENYGAGNLINVLNNKKSFFIPFDKKNIISVNLKKRVIIIDPIKGMLN
jgi:16S rRNA processing protein RimM